MRRLSPSLSLIKANWRSDLNCGAHDSPGQPSLAVGLVIGLHMGPGNYAVLSPCCLRILRGSVVIFYKNI